jgi:hypothetical protein
MNKRGVELGNIHGTIQVLKDNFMHLLSVSGKNMACQPTVRRF